MKLTTLDRARINALWGTILLFLVPITLAVVYILGRFQSGLLLALFALIGLSCAAAGVVFFVATVNQLQEASKEKLRSAQERQERKST
jgi:putative effector of murein hydrolase LrgA (UPF0299 family)